MADETEYTGQHLIAAAAIMRVKQDDFLRFSAVNLPGMTQTDHVLGVFAFIQVTNASLANHEWMKTVITQTI